MHELSMREFKTLLILAFKHSCIHAFTMKLGAHLSITGGYHKAIESVVGKGGNALQIFSASPRFWNTLNTSQETISIFLETKKRLNVHPIYFHATYLINLADENAIGEKSKKNLIAELNLASKMDVKGSIVHTGSYKKGKTEGKYKKLIENITEILSKTPSNTFLILENAGNRKIGMQIEELGEIVKTIGDKRLKICLDTCHLHASNYDLSTLGKLDEFLEKFDSSIGLDALELFHINDSKDLFGSLRDRHENIGEGKVGKDVFKLLLNHPKLRDLPFIIETPGFDDQGPDKRNLEIVKSLTLLPTQYDP